ncbi:MAG: hypothetical protein WCO54_08595 [Bacteroidota bacterium]
MKSIVIKTKSDADTKLLFKFLESSNMVDKVTEIDEDQLKLFSSEEVFHDFRVAIKKEFKRKKMAIK